MTALIVVTCTSNTLVESDWKTKLLRYKQALHNLQRRNGNEGSVTDRNLVRLFEILESCLGRKTLYTFEYFRILYFNYHEILFGIWNLCQKTVGFGISYRNLVGVRPPEWEHHDHVGKTPILITRFRNNQLSKRN